MIASPKLPGPPEANRANGASESPALPTIEGLPATTRENGDMARVADPTFPDDPAATITNGTRLIAASPDIAGLPEATREYSARDMTAPFSSSDSVGQPKNQSAVISITYSIVIAASMSSA